MLAKKRKETNSLLGIVCIGLSVRHTLSPGSIPINEAGIDPIPLVIGRPEDTIVILFESLWRATDLLHFV